MDLHDFPFDQQTLSFAFSMDQGLTQCMLVEPMPGRPRRFAHKYFTMTNVWRPVTKDMVFLGDVVDEDAPKTIQFELLLERRSSHYLTNIALPASIITYLCFSSYAPQKETEKGAKKGSNPMDIAVRLQIVFALLLTAVTFRNQVAASIPQVSYFTTLDKYVFVCFLITCAVAVETALFPLIARWWEKVDSWSEYYLLWTSVWFFTFLNIFRAVYLYLWRANRRNLMAWIPDITGYARELACDDTLDAATKRTKIIERIKQQQPAQWDALQLAALKGKKAVTEDGTELDLESTDSSEGSSSDDRIDSKLLEKFTFVSQIGVICVNLPRNGSACDGEFTAITSGNDDKHLD